MPRATRSKTRATTQRQVPYSSRPSCTTIQVDNLAAVTSPMMAYGYDQHPAYYLDPQQQQQLSRYHNAMSHPYASMPTPLSGAPAVQHVSTPVMPVQSSQTNHMGSSAWTPAMDEILIKHHKRYKWDVIAEKFLGNQKSGNACRKRHARLKKEREEPSRWEREKAQKVIEAYNSNDVRQDMWKRLADAINEDWATWEAVEKFCYNEGLKVMTNATPHRHSRRQSRAISHRSQPSINSDHGNESAFEQDEPTDDSGIGNEVASGLLQVPVHGYTPNQEYHHGELTHYTDDYYRSYQNR